MPSRRFRRGFAARAETIWAAGAFGAIAVSLAFAGVGTTVRDFFLPGTQPNTLDVPLASAAFCASCHGEFDPIHEPFSPWVASMMGQAARDPLFHACLAIANQDADFAGDLCLRCHAPMGWLGGRSEPTDGSALTLTDMQGVSCIVCHRMVDPAYVEGRSPPEDAAILAELDQIPPNPHSGSYVVDPQDRRRGPRELVDFAFHQWIESPFHQRSEMCATCHDVSNPVYEREIDGSYALGALDEPNPSADKYEQFPIERTYSEWLMSDFGLGPIDMGGRFGGLKREVSTCQDCHMPDSEGASCQLAEPRPDLATHFFNGGNTWVLRAVRNRYPDYESYLDEASVEASIARAVGMLQAASDVELRQQGPDLVVRVINQTGHKLPTGYPEGRRMWINVVFEDGLGTPIAEHGRYDDLTANLDGSDTKVYEAELGVDAAVSALTGIPVGPGFHFALNNTYYKDNRIPPRGFSNSGFEAVQAAPVGASYADGQHWDDTSYAIPPGAARARVKVYYQTASKEYMEFLRDENRTNDAGQAAYDQWALLGRSTPVEMDAGVINVTPPCLADFNVDGALNLFDFLAFQTAFGNEDPRADLAAPIGVLNLFDFLAFQTAFGNGC